MDNWRLQHTEIWRKHKAVISSSGSRARLTIFAKVSTKCINTRKKSDKPPPPYIIMLSVDYTGKRWKKLKKYIVLFKANKLKSDYINANDEEA